MYVYVRQALGVIAPRACANVAESAIFEIQFLLGKETLGKKISCSGVDSNWSLMHCRPLPSPLSHWGSGLQIWLLYC